MRCFVIGLLFAFTTQAPAELIRQEFVGEITRLEAGAVELFPNAEIGDDVNGEFFFYVELTKYDPPIETIRTRWYKFGENQPPLPSVSFSGYTVQPAFNVPHLDGLVVDNNGDGYTLVYGADENAGISVSVGGVFPAPAGAGGGGSVSWPGFGEVGFSFALVPEPNSLALLLLGLLAFTRLTKRHI